MEQNAPFVVYKKNIHILAPLEKLDFFDTQSIRLSNNITAIEAWDIAMSKPSNTLKFAFKTRDFISSKFGVKRIGGFSNKRMENIEIGNKLDFFLVEFISDTILTLTERDKHLDVLTCISIFENRLSVTSSVITHNAFGRAYMMPVSPVHKVIVNSFLHHVKDSTDMKITIY